VPAPASVPCRAGQTHWSINDLARYVAAHPELGLGKPSKSTIGVILKRGPVEDTARSLHRKRGTVRELTGSLDRVIGSADPRAQLLERARRLLKNGISGGKPYPPLAPGPGAARLLPGLLAWRMAAGLTQPELADRAGMARETVARLERLRRRARAESVEMLAHALGVPAHSLTAPTEDLPAVLRPAP